MCNIAVAGKRRLRAMCSVPAIFSFHRTAACSNMWIQDTKCKPNVDQEKEKYVRETLKLTQTVISVCICHYLLLPCWCGSVSFLFADKFANQRRVQCFFLWARQKSVCASVCDRAGKVEGKAVRRGETAAGLSHISVVTCLSPPSRLPEIRWII